MNESPQDITFRLIFNGRLVPGRNPVEIEADFAQRFGEVTTRTVFSGKSVTLNRKLSREDALKKQRILEKHGIVVQMVPSASVTADLSLVDAAPPTPVPATREPEIRDAEPELGVLPNRTPAKPTKVPASSAYSQAELADAFKDAIEVPPASRSYLVKLIPVTALMLLLPLIYLAITLLSGAITLWVAIEGLSWFADRPGICD